MNSEAHQYIVSGAVAFLPEQAKDFWIKGLKLMEASALYPDDYRILGSITPEQAAFEPDWRDLVTIKIEDRECLFHTAVDPFRIRETYPVFIATALQRILDALKNGDFTRASKLTGCFSHFIGDTGQPAHVISDGDIAELFPCRNDHMVYHSVIESFVGRAEQDYIPSLLGVDCAEINWRIIEKFKCLRRLSRTQGIPILSAIYRNNLSEAQIHANIAMQGCVEFFCDLLYTLYYYNSGKFQKKDLQRLAEFDLSTLVPEKKYCDLMYGFSPLNNRHPDFSRKNNLTHTLIDFDLGFGKIATGIALLPYMAGEFEGVRESFAEYIIPAKIFKTFEAVIGLNHLCANGSEGVFEVWLDDVQVYGSSPLSDKQPGENIIIQLKEATKIRLYVRDARPAPCVTQFFYPIWGNAVLKK